jgi:hypothetical protein
MKSFNDYKLELLKLISSLNILELQKNELRNYVNKKLDSNNYEEVVKHNKPKDYLKHIVKSYGKNNYNIYILLSSIMNFLIFNAVYFGLLFYKGFEFNRLPVNAFVLVSIIFITLIIYPLLKITIRQGLLENWDGMRIIKRIFIMLFIFFAVNILVYQVGLFNKMVVYINLKFIGSFILISIISIQIILRLFKYDQSIK